MIESETQRESRERAKKALQMTCLFQHVSPAALETVTGRMEEVRFKPGQRLGAAQGEPQDALYVVTEGKVQRERRIPRSSDRRQIVDESAHGMGDAPAFNVKVTLQPGEHGSAAIVVRGPDVDGLLGSISRALYSSGLSVVQARCEDDERSTPEQAVVRDVFVVRARTGVAIDDKQAEKIRVAITDACAVAAMGSVRLHGTNSFGTLHCLGALPAFATTTAVTPGVAWRLSQEELMAAMRSPPESSGDFVVDVASGLCAEIFRMSESYAPTPLFDQPPKRVNVAAVSVAAAFESYYRSTMNTILNARLLGTSVPATFFPNMHVQIPTRVAYINGFKMLRQHLSDWCHAVDQGSTAFHLGLVPALLPGVLMTPVSSILEACNAGHANPEPLLRRAARGVVPRTAREVIFGLGLNNLADFCEECVPPDVASSKFARNALGSMVAGVFAGYFSHVPHNLSTLKLMQPNVKYADHWRALVDHARVNRLPAALPEPQARLLATGLAIFVPAGLAIRTTQIVGSFCLINGIANYLVLDEA